MVGHLLRLLTAAALALVATATIAQANEWRVVRASGEVWIGSESPQPISLGTQTPIPDGATIVTGRSGRAQLARGSQTMVVGPNAVVEIPRGGGNFTTILQRAGEIVFDVDKQDVRHFAVESPLLAAVVKGTHFTVKVDPTRVAVTVERGLVEVTDLATGETADVGPGQGASVGGPGARLKLFGIGELGKIVVGEPRAPLVEPVSSEELRAATSQGPLHGLALGLTADPNAPNGVGLGVGIGGGNAGGNGNGNSGGNAGVGNVASANGGLNGKLGGGSGGNSSGAPGGGNSAN